MNRKKFILLLILIFANMFACAKTYKRSDIKSKQALNDIYCIAVLPFDAMTSEDGASPGKIVATMLANKLLSTGKFKVLEWEDLDVLLKSQNVTLPSSIDNSMASRIGEILSVDGVIFGSVTEYKYKKGARSLDGIPVVGIIAKLLSVKTKDFVWSSTWAGSSGDFWDTERDPLSRVALMAVNDLVDSFSKHIKKRKIDYETLCWNPFISSDVDGDAILNFADACPMEPESSNGILDTDGCPEKYTRPEDSIMLVELKDDRIIYQGNIDYVPKEATLLPSAVPILKGVASLITEHPEIQRVMIEGFSEEMGNQKFREEFSFNRAMAVKNFLMSEGVPGYKLSAVGYEKIENWKRNLIKEIEFSVAK